MRSGLLIKGIDTGLLLLHVLFLSCSLISIGLPFLDNFEADAAAADENETDHKRWNDKNSEAYRLNSTNSAVAFAIVAIGTHSRGLITWLCATARANKDRICAAASGSTFALREVALVAALGGSQRGIAITARSEGQCEKGNSGENAKRAASEGCHGRFNAEKSAGSDTRSAGYASRMSHRHPLLVLAVVRRKN